MGERSRSQRATECRISFRCKAQNRQLHKRIGGGQGLGEGERAGTALGCEVPFGGGDDTRLRNELDVTVAPHHACTQ